MIKPAQNIDLLKQHERINTLGHQKGRSKLDGKNPIFDFTIGKV